MALKSDDNRSNPLSGPVTGGMKLTRFKALAGRGRKKYAWVAALYPCLLSKFEQLSTVGVKFSSGIIRTLSMHLIAEQDDGSTFGSSVHIDGLTLENKVAVRWIERFMARNKIVLSAQRAKVLNITA